jgi:DnaJ-class molecular chaperone
MAKIKKEEKKIKEIVCPTCKGQGVVGSLECLECEGVGLKK